MRQQLAQIESDVVQKTELLKRVLTHQQTAKDREHLESSIKELKSTLAALQQEFDIKQANLSIGQKANAEANRILQSFKFENLPPIGLPTEATHVVFIIDTSGSMRNQLTQQLHYGVIEQVTELLDHMPTVKKIQFLDTSGNYMLGDRKGFWLNDTSGLRRQALEKVLNYSILSI